MKRQQATHSRISNLTDEQRALYAEIVRERIYATITLLAVLVTLWRHPADHSVGGVIGTIVGTVVALWLATIIAARMSYRMLHGQNVLEPKYKEVVESARGLLMPAGAPTFFVLLALIHVVSLQTALFMSVASLVLSLFFFSMLAWRQSSDSLAKVLLYSLLQMGLGAAVVALKILVE